MKVVVKRRQTLSDIAIQVYGDIRAVTDIAHANGVSVTETLEPGSVLECPDVVYDQYMQNYVRMKNIQPATGI